MRGGESRGEKERREDIGGRERNEERSWREMRKRRERGDRK